MNKLLSVMALMLAFSAPVAGIAESVLPLASKAEAPGRLTSSATGIKIVFHPAYQRVYALDPAAEPGRMESILGELQGVYEFVQPKSAKDKDITKVHTQSLLDRTFLDPEKETGPGAGPLYSGRLDEIARLAAGGAILAAELAVAGEVVFGLIRPPGHHASYDQTYGHTYLNNIAIAVRKLLDEKKIERALIVDFDLHPGDGTESIFRDDRRVTYYWLPVEGDRTQQLETLEEYLKEATDYDILAVSAGFDRGKEDWGGIFEIEDFRTIGQLLKGAAERNSQGKRFAVLEGGYNPQVLGKNVKAFLEGFE